MRGYFGIGVEGISKPVNLGSLFRTAHAFGAEFVFTVAAAWDRRQARRLDTSDAPGHVPFYRFPDIASMVLPQGCKLVGVELVEDAADLPSFPHPLRAAYVLGRERGSLTPAMLERCDHVVRIPTRFCLNLSIAGAVVMYDRVRMMGGFPPRPVSALARPEEPAPHVFGNPIFRDPESRRVFLGEEEER